MGNPYNIPPLWKQLCHPVKLLSRILDLVISLLRPHNPVRRNITLVCLSDTHTLIPSTTIPFGDVLIHAGDLANTGTPEELQAQIDWLASLPHQFKVVIAGNHDAWLDPRSRKSLPDPEAPGPDWKNITYLQDSSVTLELPHRTSINEGMLKIYGSPRTPDVLGPDHAFQYVRGHDHWDRRIPDDADIVVTHGPPKYHLDLPGVRAMGDEFLLREVRRVKPLVHVFGHMHAGKSDFFGQVRGGREVVRWDRCERYFERAMQGSALALVMMFVHGAIALFGDWVLDGDVRSTVMVNAAMMYCNTGKLGNEAQVVHI